jgi:hypothetical protein
LCSLSDSPSAADNFNGAPRSFRQPDCKSEILTLSPAPPHPDPLASGVDGRHAAARTGDYAQAQALSEEIVIDPTELADARWFSREEAAMMIARRGNRRGNTWHSGVRPSAGHDVDRL